MRIKRVEPVHPVNYTQDSTYRQKSHRNNKFKEELRKAAVNKKEEVEQRGKVDIDTDIGLRGR